MHRIEKLKIELAAGHPDTGPYSANNATAAVEINVVNRTKPIPFLTGDGIFQATNESEFAGLSNQKRDLWLSFCARHRVDPFGSANVAFVKYIFDDPSATLTALAVLRSKAVSRADELGITRVREGTVAEARM